MTDPSPGRLARLRARLRAALARRPWADRALRAVQHNGAVGGSQLAAAITYFGFLSFFPLLALAFAVVGYVSGAYPGAQDSVTSAVQDVFPSLVGSGPGRIDVHDVIAAKAGAGVIGLAGLLYSGLGWVDALRAGLRRVFGTSGLPLGLVRKKAVDVLVLVSLGLALLASVVVTSLATTATTQVLGLVDLDGSAVAVAMLKVLSVAVAMAADTVLFAILLSRLSGARLPWRRVRGGAVLGAVGFEGLKLVGTFLVARTTANPVYATFGVVVGLLVWINLVSRLLVLVACWTATDAQPPLAGPEPGAADAPAGQDGAGRPGRPRRRLPGWRVAALGAAAGAALAVTVTRRRRT